MVQGQITMKTVLILIVAVSVSVLAFAVPPVNLPMVQNEDAVELPLPPPPGAFSRVPAIDLKLVRPLEQAVAKSRTSEAIQTAAADPEVTRMLAAVRQDSPRSALESMLYDQLRAALPAGSDGVVLDKASLPSDLKLPASGWDAKFEFHVPARGVGTVPYVATVSGADGRVLRKFSGAVRLDREVRGVQVTRVIRRGEEIAEADVRPMTGRLSELDRGAIDDPSVVVGSVAKQEMRPGRWVTEQMTEVPKIVKRGQGVTLRLARGPISIVTSGITSEAGARGQVIKVKNVQSNREVYARVVSSDEVQVIF